jgi:hypothetical protein
MEGKRRCERCRLLSALRQTHTHMYVWTTTHWAWYHTGLCADQCIPRSAGQGRPLAWKQSTNRIETPESRTNRASISTDSAETSVLRAPNAAFATKLQLPAEVTPPAPSSPSARRTTHKDDQRPDLPPPNTLPLFPPQNTLPLLPSSPLSTRQYPQHPAYNVSAQCILLNNPITALPNRAHTPVCASRDIFIGQPRFRFI